MVDTPGGSGKRQDRRRGSSYVACRYSDEEPHDYCGGDGGGDGGGRGTLPTAEPWRRALVAAVAYRLLDADEVVRLAAVAAVLGWRGHAQIAPALRAVAGRLADRRPALRAAAVAALAGEYAAAVADGVAAAAAAAAAGGGGGSGDGSDSDSGGAAATRAGARTTATAATATA